MNRPRNPFFFPTTWAFTVVVLTWALFSGLSGFYPSVEWVSEVRWHYLAPVFFVFLSWMISELFWIFGERNRNLYSIVFCALFASCLILVHIVAKQDQLKHDQLAVEAIRETRIALRQQIAQRNREARTMVLDRLQRAKTDRFANYEGKIESKTLQAIKAIDKEMQDKLQSLIDDYQQALDNNPTQGPEAWIRFRTLDQLEVARTRHVDLYEHTNRLYEFMKGFEKTYQAKLDQLDLKPPADRVAVAELERVLQYWENSKTLRLRQLDVHMLEAALGALNLLRESWGAWEFNPRESRLIFDQNQTEQSFYQYLEELRLISDEVEKISKELSPNS